MKKLILAALLAATTASADAAVTYTFAGTEFDSGAAVSGSITIDTDALIGANGATDPALDYSWFSDGGGSVANPYLTVSFTSAGTNPALLSSGDWSQHLLQADPSTGNFLLEIDWQVFNPDNTITASSFFLQANDPVVTQAVNGVLLPDFMHSGSFSFVAMSGTGDNETYDTLSSGLISFAAAPAAVPEAATWTMMVLGFGAVGYAARRRTRVAFAA